MTVSLALIVCMARNGVIGRAGGMPWRMPSDLAYFKGTTMGKPMIMGRKTFATFGRPLPGRPHIVITRTPSEAERIGAAFPPGAPPHHVVDTLAKAIDIAAAYAASEIMVIGGGEIYAEALPLAQRVYQTILSAEVEGDTRFPALPQPEWREISRVPLATGPRDDYAADTVVFQRV